MEYTEFSKTEISDWRAKAKAEIHDKSFEETLSRTIGEDLIIAAYADSYIATTEELLVIQQVQKKSTGWQFQNVQELQNSRNNEVVISAVISKNIKDEIVDLLSKTQQFLEENAMDSNTVASEKITIEVNLTPDYLLTIAKVRAVRFLIVSVLGSYGSEIEFSIKGLTDQNYYKTDNEHINIVRATTMVMSGVIGGCDALHIVPFDKTDNEFSSRIAKNISLILAEEAYLSEVNDPAAGSYFIENLTYLLVKKSWESFVAITHKT